MESGPQRTNVKRKNSLNQEKPTAVFDTAYPCPLPSAPAPPQPPCLRPSELFVSLCVDSSSFFFCNTLILL